MCSKWLAVLLTVNTLALSAMATPESSTLMVDQAFVVVQDAGTTSAILNTLALGSGEPTPIGDIGFEIAALAFSKTGLLFGIDPELDVLVRIDPSDGTGVAVGPLGIDLVGLPGSDLTFDSTNNLWMMGTASGLRGLYRVDLNTGNAQWVAPVDAPFAKGLAAVGGELVAANYSLGILNPEDGTVDSVSGADLSGFQAQWMSFGSRGTLWAVAVCGVCAAPWDVVALLTFDPETSVVAVHDFGLSWGSSRIRGLAIRSFRRPQKVAPAFVQ